MNKQLNNQILKAQEQIDIESAKYLLSLPYEKLAENIGGGEFKGDKIYTNKDTYIKELKCWLKKSVNKMNDNECIKTTYKYSKNLVDCGRIYVKGFGIQKLTKELRGFLIKRYSTD